MLRNEPETSADASARLMGPLTFSQRKIWFADQISDRNADTQRQIVQLRFGGQIDTTIVRSALLALIRRHAILRTSFHSDGGDPYQRIWPAPDRLFFPELEFGGSTTDAVERKIRKLMAEEARRPFNLSQAPLGRCMLIKHGDRRAELVMALHRIIVDDASIAILTDDLMTICAAKMQRRPLPRRLIKAQFIDIALRQWQHAGAASVRERLHFWQDHMRGSPPCAEVEADSPAAGAVGRLGRVRVPLGAVVAADLARTASTLGVAIHVPLIAAWAVLLSRLGATGNIVMGLLLPRQHTAGADDVVGPLDDIVPFHMRACDSATIDELLTRIGADIAMIGTMASTPGEWIIGNTEHGLLDDVLDRVMVQIQGDRRCRPSSTGLSLYSQQPAELHSASFGLALRIGSVDGELSAELIYAADKFPRANIRSLASRLCRLAGTIAGDGSRLAASLPLLSKRMQRRIVTRFNPGKAPVEPDALLHHLFERQVRRHPDHPALSFGRSLTTYRELNVRANKVAHHLCASGIGAEDRVAVCMPRGEDMIVAMLGVLKAGAAYVPLDPGLPEDRLHLILQDCGAVAAIAPRPFAGLCERACLRRIDIKRGSGRAAIATASGRNPRLQGARSQPRNLAYVIYTSGSSGHPKGVLVEHASAVSSTLARQRYYGSTGRALLISPISFDSSIAVVYGTLATGGTLVIASETVARDARALARKIASENIEFVLTVPEFLRQILEELAGLPGVNPALRLVTAGEACPRSLVETAGAMSLRLFNEYGPTEGTVWASVHDCSELASRSMVPIGRPIDTARIYILDLHGMPVPVGMIGEICIGGEGVARGYMNRPELTAERFVEDPFDRTGGGRMYRSGDLGRWLPSGDVEFCGRRDSQVKVRGYRIELEEIESQLAGIATIDAAAVRLEETGANSRRLVAYIVCRDRTHFRPAAFSERMSRALPAYMVPAAYVHIESFPLTPNGKIDRAALPTATQRAVVRGGYSAPRGDRELRLATLWSTLLGVPRIGRTDDFFQLGGDSLSAARLVAICRKEGWRSSVHDLFQSPTLTGFARRLRAAQ